MSNNLGDYLRRLRGKESLRSVSDRVGGRLSHSYISDLEKGVSRRGTPINPTPEALKILAEAYVGKTTYSDLMELAGYIKQRPSNVIPLGDAIPEDNSIPVLGRIAASAPAGLVSDHEGELFIQPSTIKRYGKKDLFALKINGDSMNRIIPDGAIAVVHRTCDWESGDICAVTINGDDATLKQVTKTDKGIKFTPLSFSKFHAPWEYIKDEDEVDVCILGTFLYGVIPTDKM